MKLPTLNFSTPVFVVLISQVIIVAIMALNLLSLSPYAMGTIEHLPPTTFLYFGEDVSWIGAGRTISHVITAIMNFIISAMCIWYSIGRKVKIIRFITATVGVQFALSSVVNLTLAGVLALGSWWHVATFASTILMTVSAVATAVVFMMLISHLKHLGDAHDKMIEQIGHSDE